MSKSALEDIARHFCVSDVTGATIQGSRLSKILDNMHHSRPLTALSLKYLQEQNLSGLYQLATGEITYDVFTAASGSAVQARRHATEAARLVREEIAEAERQAAVAMFLAREAGCAAEAKRERQVEEAARIARERDPKYIAETKHYALLSKYGLGFMDQSLPPRMMSILNQIDSGSRLTAVDSAWLTTVAKAYYTEELRVAYHLREAKFFAAEYDRTQDPWNVVNASAQYRKCSRSETALGLLNSVPPHCQDLKLKSAMSTTRGGVMRDLGHLDEALQLGAQGHELQPDDFRPCTLLGALHMELGNLLEAHDWYSNAEERGASKRSIDSEIRRIFQRADKANREAIKNFLLAENPARYSWVNATTYRLHEATRGSRASSHKKRQEDSQ
ncbi:MAG: hypothetical protein V5B30_12635 [Candidatus Accumulibacter delftensis]|jgi:hypothetical protein